VTRTAILLGAVLIVAGAIAASIVLFASDEGPAEPAALPPEQDDYLYRAAEVMSVMNRGRAASTFPLYYAEPEEIGPIEELDAATAKWRTLGPPPELAEEHRAVSVLFSRMLRAYAPGAEQEATLELGEEPYNDWLEAVYDHYPEILVDGAAYMEPAFCGDVIVFDPSDGHVDRWQVVFVRFPPDGSIPDFLQNGRGVVLRVAGLPGETIEVVPDGAIVDGTLHTDYAVTRTRESFGPVTIPGDSYFLLADQRGKAIDSRNDRIPGNPSFYSRAQITGELPRDATACEFS
jgi:hypothetical protein